MKIGVQNLVTLVRFLSIITVGKMQLLQSIKKINQSRKLKVFILKYCVKCPYTHWIKRYQSASIFTTGEYIHHI